MRSGLVTVSTYAGLTERQWQLDGELDIVIAKDITMKIRAKGTVYFPRRELTLAERVAIIKEHEKSVRTGLIAQKYSCSKQQVRRILHRKDEYLDLWSRSTDDEVEVVRRLRSPLLIATGRILYEWLIRARYYMDVTDEDIRRTGRAIAAHIQYKHFKSNNRWLNRFKNKYKLHNMKLKGMSKGVVDRKQLKSLDIADIIADVKRDDPGSLLDLELEKQDDEEESPDALMDVRDLPDVPDHIDLESDDDGERSGASPYDQGIGMDVIPLDDNYVNDEAPTECAKEISTYKEAINLLGPLEQFALLKENIRAVGLLNQLENLFRDEISKGND